MLGLCVYLYYVEFVVCFYQYRNCFLIISFFLLTNSFLQQSLFVLPFIIKIEYSNI